MGQRFVFSTGDKTRGVEWFRQIARSLFFRPVLFSGLFDGSFWYFLNDFLILLDLRSFFILLIKTSRRNDFFFGNNVGNEKSDETFFGRPM